MTKFWRQCLVFREEDGHEWYKCDPCDNPGNCPICDTGLALCVICGCAEGELLGHCPGRKLNEETRADIYNGRIIDFFGHEFHMARKRRQRLKEGKIL